MGSAYILLLSLAIGQERGHFLALLVDGNHLKGTVGWDSHQVDCLILVGRVGNLALEDVGLEVVVCGIDSLESDILGRELLHALDIGVDLEIEAAFELGALSGQLLGVEGYVLVASGAGGHGHKVGHP